MAGLAQPAPSQGSSLEAPQHERVLDGAWRRGASGSARAPFVFTYLLTKAALFARVRCVSLRCAVLARVLLPCCASRATG